MKRLVVAALVLLCLPALAACGGSVPPDLPVESGGNEANIIFEPSALESVLRQMNLEEKVAQMLMASCHEKGSAQRAAAAGLGGVCLYADAFEGKSIAEVTAFTGSLQSMSGAGLFDLRGRRGRQRMPDQHQPSAPRRAVSLPAAAI